MAQEADLPAGVGGRGRGVASAQERCRLGIARGARARLTRLSCAALAVIAIAAPSLGAPGARAASAYVDGVSDQNLPFWDHSFSSSPFAASFRSSWVGGDAGHIRLARYFLDYHVLSMSSRASFEAWLSDVREAGLTPDIALTTFSHPAVHPSPARYQEALAEILALADSIDHVAYVEAWNEPNNQGGFPRPAEAITPARYANEADTVCAADDCQVIAGDLEDNPQAARYQHAYVQGLTWKPALWGVHPYHAIRDHSDVKLLALERQLAAEGLPNAEPWFTEAGAYFCLQGKRVGAAAQAADAAYLADDLIPAVNPAHVFYYEFMYKNDEPLRCAESDDTELYGPGGAPRPAAAAIANVPGAGALAPARGGMGAPPATAAGDAGALAPWVYWASSDDGSLWAQGWGG